MAARRILQLGDPLLRSVSLPAHPANEVAGIFDDLRATLHEFQRTRGISAVQIGEPKRLIYIEVEGHAWRLRNPVLEYRTRCRFPMTSTGRSLTRASIWHGPPCRLRQHEAAGMPAPHSV
jgi:hypothetical protein